MAAARAMRDGYVQSYKLQPVQRTCTCPAAMPYGARAGARVARRGRRRRSRAAKELETQIARHEAHT